MRAEKKHARLCRINRAVILEPIEPIHVALRKQATNHITCIKRCAEYVRVTASRNAPEGSQTHEPASSSCLSAVVRLMSRWQSRNEDSPSVPNSAGSDHRD